MNIINSTTESTADEVVTGPFVWTVTGDLKHGMVNFSIDIGGGFATALVVTNETIKAGSLSFPAGSTLRVTLSGDYGDCLVDIMFE